MTDGGDTDIGIREAREAVAALAAAMAAAALYPPDHAGRRRAAQRLADRLARFLSAHDSLRLRVTPDGLQVGETTVFSDPDPAGLPAVLFRDGVRWIGFRRGIPPREVREFLEILGRFRTPKPELEGDIVTALWEAHLPHIPYEAEDPLAMREPLDLAALNRGAAGGCWGEARADAEAPGLAAAGPALWTLTEADLERIGRMVAAEENWEGTADVLDVLIVILEVQADPEDFGTILSYIEEEFQAVLEAGDFGLAVNLLRNLRRLRTVCRRDRAWAVPLLDDAFRDLSGARFLSLFAEVDLDLLGADALEEVRTLLSLLPPSALETLMPMLPAARSRRARRALMTAAVRLARADARPLTPFLEGTPDPALAQYLVEIARRLSPGTAGRLLFRLVRHPDAGIRNRALSALLAVGGGRPEMVRPLLDDPDPMVWEQVHRHLARGRDPGGERLLLDWLAGVDGADPDRVAAAYRTLGRCGSAAAIPALRRALFRRPLGRGRGRRRMRSAAARALADLDSAAAESVLARAARSPFPAVRRAVWRVWEERT